MRYALIIMSFVVSLSVPAYAQQRSYDAQGRYVGRTQTDPRGNIRQYDAQGRFVGEARPGPNDRYRTYDAQGRFNGETRNGPPVRLQRN